MIAVDTNMLVYAHRRESRHRQEAATSPEQSWRQLSAWIASPSLRLIGETEDFPEILEGFVRRPRVFGGAVHDAGIAAICVAHGAEALLTRDRDFSLFPELRPKDPIAEASG